jgi:hypothetical protein
MLSCRVWSLKKFIGDGGRSSVCLDSVAIHDGFSTVLESSEVVLSATPCRFVFHEKISGIVNLFILWCGDLNLVCLGWRDYTSYITYVWPNLDLATT